MNISTEIAIEDAIQDKIDKIYKTSGVLIKIYDNKIYLDGEIVASVSTFGGLKQVYMFLHGWVLGWNKGLKK